MNIKPSASEIFNMAKKKQEKRSLTRELFLSELAIKPVEVEVGGVVVYVKPVSELKRSQRAAQMFDKKGEIDQKYLEKRRVLAIIDHLCDENGEMLFTEKDIKDLQELDSVQIDPYYQAIELALGEEVGNE